VQAFISDTMVQTIGSVLGFATLFLIRHILKDRADKAEARFKAAVEIAYNVVNEASRLTKTTADDKVALGLKALKDYLATHGQDVTQADEERAKLLFTAMHGAESK
jgi:hypothetical protein